MRKRVWYKNPMGHPADIASDSRIHGHWFTWALGCRALLVSILAFLVQHDYIARTKNLYISKGADKVARCVCAIRREDGICSPGIFYRSLHSGQRPEVPPGPTLSVRQTSGYCPALVSQSQKKAAAHSSPTSFLVIHRLGRSLGRFSLELHVHKSLYT